MLEHREDVHRPDPAAARDAVRQQVHALLREEEKPVVVRHGLVPVHDGEREAPGVAPRVADILRRVHNEAAQEAVRLGGNEGVVFWDILHAEGLVHKLALALGLIIVTRERHLETGQHIAGVRNYYESRSSGELNSKNTPCCRSHI